MFVLYLSDQRDVSYCPNQYGYYGGKCFKKDDCIWPLADATVVERTKRYSTRGRAEAGGNILLEKCSYVMSYSIEEA
jgi:hypothetical protein